MTNTRSTVLLLASLAPSAAVSAQDVLRSFALPASGFVPAALGEYTGHRRPHAILIHEQAAYLGYSPANHAWVKPVAEDWLVNDVATQHKSGEDQGDSVLGIGPAGLTLGQFDGSGVFSWTVLGTGDWIDGVQLECAGSTAAALVVGLAEDHTTLGIGALDGGSLIAEVWASQGAEVQQFVLFDWDKDGTPEVAVLTAGSLRILDSTLSPLVILSGGGGSIAKLAIDASADQLAWVRPAGRTYELVVLTPSSASTPLHLTLPLSTGTTDLFSLVGIVTGDADGDGLFDVAIAQNTTTELVVLYRQPGSTPFVLPSFTAPVTGKIIDYGGSPGALNVLPIFGDFSNDAFADLFLSRDQTGFIYKHHETVLVFPTEFQMLPNEAAPEHRLKVRFVPPPDAEPYDAVQMVVYVERCPLSGGVPNVPLPTASGTQMDLYANNYHILAHDSGGVLPLQEVVLGMRQALNNNVWASVGGQAVQAHLWIEMRKIVPGEEPDYEVAPFATFGVTIRNNSNLQDSDVELPDPFPQPLVTVPTCLSRLLSGNPATDGSPRGIRGRSSMIGGIVPVQWVPKEHPLAGTPDEGSHATGVTDN